MRRPPRSTHFPYTTLFRSLTNINVGTNTAKADASYAGDANHTGSNATQVSFSITAAGSTTTISCAPGSFTYTGSAITPCTATVTRVGDADTTTTVSSVEHTSELQSHSDVVCRLLLDTNHTG